MNPTANKIIMNPEAAEGMLPGAPRSIADERQLRRFGRLAVDSERKRRKPAPELRRKRRRLCCARRAASCGLLRRGRRCRPAALRLGQCRRR